MHGKIKRLFYRGLNPALLGILVVVFQRETTTGLSGLMSREVARKLARAFPGFNGRSRVEFLQRAPESLRSTTPYGVLAPQSGRAIPLTKFTYPGARGRVYMFIVGYDGRGDTLYLEHRGTITTPPKN